MNVIPLSDLGLLTVDDAAALRGVHERTIRAWVRQGRLPVVLVGSSNRQTLLFRKRDVERVKAPARGRPVED